MKKFAIGILVLLASTAVVFANGQKESGSAAGSGTSGPVTI